MTFPAFWRFEASMQRQQRRARAAMAVLLASIIATPGGCERERGDGAESPRPARVMVIKQNGDVIETLLGA